MGCCGISLVGVAVLIFGIVDFLIWCNCAGMLGTQAATPITIVWGVMLPLLLMVAIRAPNVGKQQSLKRAATILAVGLAIIYWRAEGIQCATFTVQHRGYTFSVTNQSAFTLYNAKFYLPEGLATYKGDNPVMDAGTLGPGETYQANLVSDSAYTSYLTVHMTADTWVWGRQNGDLSIN